MPSIPRHHHDTSMHRKLSHRVPCNTLLSCALGRAVFLVHVFPITSKPLVPLVGTHLCGTRQHHAQKDEFLVHVFVRLTSSMSASDSYSTSSISSA